MRSDFTASSMWRVKIDVLADRLQHEGLFAIAELLVAGLALPSTASGPAAANLPSAPVAARCTRIVDGLGVRVDVVRLGALAP